MGKPIILSDLFRQSWKSLWAQIWVLSGLLIGYVIIGLLLNAFIPPSDNHIGVAGIVIIAIWFSHWDILKICFRHWTARNRSFRLTDR